MTPYILAALALWVVHLFLPAIARARSGAAEQHAYLRGNRDHEAEHTMASGRFRRAQDNYLESLIIFLPIALLAHISHAPAQLGAIVFLAARTAYPFAYAMGIPLVRSACWTVGFVGLGLMVHALF